MAMGIIELNDAGVRVSSSVSSKESSDHGNYVESPGVAVVNRKDLLLGDAALRQSRLQPLETNTLFWHRLSAEPLSFQNNQYRHHADLAYSHLLSLHQNISDCDEVIFALPGSFTRQQMSLLLGIVGQCPFNAVGLVDSAVAASAPHAKADSLVHIDLQLHQCVFTRMRADGQLQRTHVDVLPLCGLLTLRDRWAKAIADQFIDQSRFDPLHSAVTEQSLYDQLPEWLSECHRNGELFIEVGGKTIKLTREQVIHAVQGIYSQIITKADQLVEAQSQLLLGDRLAALPGLVDAFADTRSGEVESLSKSAVMEGIHSNLDAIKTGTEQISFIQALPLPGGTARSRHRPTQTGATQTGATQASATRSAATQTSANKTSATQTSATKANTRQQETKSRHGAAHLLIGDTAWPLGETHIYVDLDKGRLANDPAVIDAHCSLHRRGDVVTLIPHNGATITVNAGEANEAIARDNRLLRSGDRVSLQGHTGAPLVLINVMTSSDSG